MQVLVFDGISNHKHEMQERRVLNHGHPVIQVCQVGSGVYRSKNEGKDLVPTWVFETNKETRRECTRIHELTTFHKEAVQIWTFNWLEILKVL